MNSSTSDQRPVENERSDRAVLCSKCEKLNAWGTNECSRCGARLYIACSDCGHKNERVRSRCSSCNRRLHHSLVERLLRRAKSGASEMSSVQVVIFCLSVAVAFVVIIFLATMDFPHLF